MVNPSPARAAGFTIIELMLVVAIIGIIAAIAIPNFLKYQLRSKSGEAAVNVTSLIRTEVALVAARDSCVDLGLLPRSDATLDDQKFPWPTDTALQALPGWNMIGWRPEGSVYFNYQAQVDATAAWSMTVEAHADIDNDDTLQCWGHRHTNSLGDNTLVFLNSTACSDYNGVRFDVTYKSSLDGLF